MNEGFLLHVVAVLTLAGLVQGLTGFGFGMVAMGLLPLVIELEQAQAIITLTNLIVCVLMVGVKFSDVEWRGARRLLIAALVGVPFGYAFVEQLPYVWATRLLGVALCSMVLFDSLIARRMRWRLPPLVGWFCGLGGGLLGGAFNIGGPPIVAYVYSQPWTKQQQVATLSMVFLSSGLMRFALVTAHGELTASVWQAVAWSALPLLIATYVGHRLLDFVSQPVLRGGVYTGIFVLGSCYLIRGA
ncbi:MAG: sulfite exporter TauE/SafE family protein [Planctomycetes bacterium]|nr:sulfite exporter TauE/SafE family protein [Planctomycetota bacterium]